MALISLYSVLETGLFKCIIRVAIIFGPNIDSVYLQTDSIKVNKDAYKNASHFVRMYTTHPLHLGYLPLFRYGNRGPGIIITSLYTI